MHHRQSNASGDQGFTRLLDNLEEQNESSSMKDLGSMMDEADIVPMAVIDTGIDVSRASLTKRNSRTFGPSKPGLFGKLSTNNLLDMGILSSVSRQSSSEGFFPHSTRAPSTARLPVPWSASGDPNANKDGPEADMLCGLAVALATYGAPLYRVEHRVSQAAQDLNIPLTIFCLPSTVQISIGDGSSQHPTRARYLCVEPTLHMGKLHQVDQLARRIRRLRIPTKGKAPDRLPSTLKKNHISGTPIMSTISLNETSSPQNSRPPQNSPEIEHDRMNELLDALHLITESPNDYHPAIRIFAAACQSFNITVLLFRGSWADSICACLLGGLAGFGLWVGELADVGGAMELFVAISTAMIARALSQLPFWPTFGGMGHGLCHEVVVLGGICSLLPGISITVGMIEFGSHNPVAGSVRMFGSCIRALKLGYGLTMGSRIAIEGLSFLGLWSGFDTQACSALQNSGNMEWWRYFFWIPMNISIMVLLKAEPWQWVHMSAISAIGYTTSIIASQIFSNDVTVGFAAFALGIAANIYARRTNQIAIGGILAGIFWLVPGSTGVRGAIAAFQKDDAATSGGAGFGLDMIVRAMAIAVGL
ncbi:hypothetical protein HK097_007977 [Rhizophlyctis rosea]|uniref:Threonine/serine exporter-like N-terminal domain-containing protein n=1 Tax=Rhizophlyctis rosea TaxID=64517 RepID=A0AAD5SQ84_9FUNG|nr:hypothetical protein HK097_007977 [Rhizophlyctis rosea]